MRPILKGSTDQSVVIRIIDSTDGTPETGVVFNTSGIDLWYRREGATKTSITEATLTNLNDAHSDGGVLHIGDGYYRLDLPDAAVATSANGVAVGGTVTGMVVIGCYVPLVDYNPYDGVRLGLTSLPNAAAEAAGGIYTRGTGPGQINQAANGMVDINIVRLGNSATPITNMDTVFNGDFAANYNTTADGWVVKLGNYAHGGSSAAVTFSTLTVNGATVLTGNVSMAAGLTITQSTTNGNAITATGNGTGAAFRMVGGATGRGLEAVAGASGQSGIYASGGIYGLHATGSTYGALLSGSSALILVYGAGSGMEFSSETANSAIYAPGQTAVLGATSVSSFTNSGTTTLTGNVTLSGTLGVGATTLASLAVTGALTTGSITNNGTTTLTGAVATGAVTLNALTVTNNLLVSGTATVTGTTSLAAVITSGTVTLNALTVTNATTLTGAVSLGSTLGVSGTTTLAALITSGTVTLNALTVTNATTLSGALSATNASNDFRGVKLHASTHSGATIPTVTDVTNLHASAATAANQTTILARLGSFAGSGVNTVLGMFKALLSKTASTPSDVGGTFDPATDSTEAIRDRGDAAWITAAGFSTHSAADVWSVGTRLLTAGTNIVLAKGTGVTGFNDLSAAQVNTEADTALSDVGLTSTITGRIDAAVSTRLATSGYTAPDNASIATIATKAALAEKILRNKMTTNPSTGAMVLYDDDGTTPLLTTTVYENIAGSQTYRGQGVDRKDRLA